MELQQIVDRYAEAIEYIDTDTDVVRANPRTGDVYHTSFKSLPETRALDAIDTAWEALHPDEFRTKAEERVGVRYPDIPRAKCDHVFSTEPTASGEPEWGIEVKKIEFVGNNGNANDYGVGKMLSPYLKDRGLLHDAARLRQHGFTHRIAVIGYVFNYDAASLADLRRLHPGEGKVISNVEAVLRRNGGALSSRPLIEFTDAILGLRGYLRGPRREAPFSAFRSPSAGRGIVFGWEISRPWREPEYDERHPW